MKHRDPSPFKLQRYRSSLTACLFLIFLTFGLWGLIPVFGDLPDFLLPSPIQVFHAAHKQFDYLLAQTKITMIETFLGLLMGWVSGSFMAFSMLMNRHVKFALLPLLIISQAIPSFALAPLLVLWFGYGILAKIILIALMLFFPIASNLYDSLNRTKNIWLNLASTMQASPLRTLWFIRLPAAFPGWASGLRVAAVIAPMAAIIGEWIGSSAGLGYVMLNANARLETPLLFTSILILMVFSLTLYIVIDVLMKMLIPWEPRSAF